MSTMTRGPLPSGVYWRRRGFAVLLAITLVFVVARVLNGGSDASDSASADQQTAQQVAAEPTDTASASPTSGPGKNNKSKNKNKTATPTPTPLAEPNGPCIEADLVVTPLVSEAIAGSGVPIVLQLRTNFAEACTWEVSSELLQVKIASGDDDVWSTVDCPGRVPVQDVVVRRDVPSTVGLVWGTKRSDEDCSALTDWAAAGTYQVAAAALGGEPTETTFELELPSPEIIVTTPKPTPDKSKQTKNKQTKNKQKKKKKQN